jgi:ferrochelatase
MSMKQGVILLNMGGPETLAEVRPFLSRLFSDRDIIPLPLGDRAMRLFGWTFSRLRAPWARRAYAQMGGGSPQKKTCERQAGLLEERLNALAPAHGPWRCYLALRYTPPFADEALCAARKDGIERLFVLPLYPQFSSVTTGSSFNDLSRAFVRTGFFPREVVYVRDWHDDPGYLDALAASIERTLATLSPEDRAEATLVFSAHALPLRVVARGDPYPGQIERTVAGALARLGDPPPFILAWQSQARPFVKWLEPRTDAEIERLAAEKKRVLVLVPVAFVQEHIETLYELDILYRDLARARGVRTFARVPALGEDPRLVEALARVILHAGAP